MYQHKTGKNLTMKDVHNIVGKSIRANDCSNDVHQLSEYLKENHPTLEVEYVIDNEQATGIFIQDLEMRKQFQKFPETILIDATFKTNNCEMSFYCMMCVDGNGESQVVAAFLLLVDDKTSVRQMVKHFKENNPFWHKIQVCITDKDMVERNVFKSEMPQVEMQICLFHVLKIFSREVTRDKMGVTHAEQDTIKSSVQECCYAYSS